MCWSMPIASSAALRVDVSAQCVKYFPATCAKALTSDLHANHMFQVDELIQGLGDLGCLRTSGEDQTICVMSDSFNNRGGAAGLQASGDLPDVDIVKVR